MKRRALILGLLTRVPPAAIGWGIATSAFAQPAERNLPHVAVVTTRDEAGFRPFRESLVQGMRELGQIEGKTYRLQVLYADGEQTRAAGLILDAVASRPDILVVSGLTNAKRAREATKTIAVVVAVSSDLVDAGVIASFARPGGNITGTTDLADELAEKRLEWLMELLPKARRVALLNNPDFPAVAKIESRVGAVARRLGVTVLPLYAKDRASLALAIESLGKSRPDALLIGGDGLFVANARPLIEGASAHGVPVIHYWPGTAEMGALLSHHVDVKKAYERTAHYVDRILKGAKPGDLPVERPTRYELVVSRKAANGFGITIPPTLVLRADRIVD